MLESISFFKRYLVAVTLGVFAALLFLITPVPAAETPLAPAEAPPALAEAPPAVPPDLTPAELAALTPEEMVERAEALSAAAFFRATQALADGNLTLAQEAQNLAGQASSLFCIVSNAATQFADAENVERVQSALNVSVQVSETLNLVLATAASVASTSTDPNTVAAANLMQTAATTTLEGLISCQQAAIAAGASMAVAEEAYEPPGALAALTGFNPTVAGAAVPITDLPPASPI